MRKGIVSVLGAICFLVSCKNDKLNNVFAQEGDVLEDSVEVFVGDTLHLFDENEETPVNVDELFDDFFFNFADDHRFQSQRIAFPLLYKEGDSHEEKISRQDWSESESFSLPEVYAFIYEREHDMDLLKDTMIQSVGVEWVHLADESVKTYNFNRRNGKWMLTALSKEPALSTPNGTFLHFYSQFMSDTTFQRRSLAIPVKMILTSEDAEDDVQEEYLQPEDWFEISGDLPLPNQTLVNLDFGQTSISQNRKILLISGMGNGLQMRFVFNKADDDWQLVEIIY